MLNCQEEKNVYSEQHKEEEQVKEFMEYMVKSGTALNIIKYMVHLRSCDSFPNDPLGVLRNHFAVESNENMEIYKQLVSEYQVLKEENELLNKEKLDLENELDSLKHNQTFEKSEESSDEMNEEE